MAYINANQPHLSSIASYSFVRFVAQMMEQVKSGYQAHVTRKRLSALSDHQLHDIGLTRADVQNFSRG